MTESNNWANDRLNRKASGDFLSTYLVGKYQRRVEQVGGNVLHGSEPNTFVLNVRAPWGFGKTFFLKALSSDLRDAGHPVVYYDAWANDFSDDPLVGFMAEVSNSLSRQAKVLAPAEQKLDEAMAVGRKLLKPAALVIGSAVAKHLTGLSLDSIQEALTNGDVSDLASGFDNDGLLAKLGDLALKQHLNQKEQISVFREKMGRYVEEISKNAKISLPIFIFVDELDRCRPSYAIELLESIKHIFGINGIYFVLATNLTELGHSVGAVYGERFDSERYLKRFFDQEYVLPQPRQLEFVGYLFEKHGFSSSESAFELIGAPDGYPGRKLGEVIFDEITKSLGMAPRDQVQIAGVLEGIIYNWPKGERIHWFFLVYLVALKHLSAELFDGLEKARNDAGRRINQAVGIAYNVGHLKFRMTQGPSAFDPPYSQHVAPQIEDVLDKYLEAMSMSMPAIMDRQNDRSEPGNSVFRSILQDMPRSYSPSSPPMPKLGEYFGRIRHAGQLSDVEP